MFILFCFILTRKGETTTSKILKIMTAILNLIYGFCAGWVIMFVIAFWNDMSPHYTLLSITLAGYLVINAIAYLISYLITQKRITGKTVILTSVIPCAIGMLITFLLFILMSILN